MRFRPNVFANDLVANCRVASVYHALLRGKALMAQDAQFSLTEVFDTCRAYYQLITKNCRGIFHIASPDISNFGGGGIGPKNQRILKIGQSSETLTMLTKRIKIFRTQASKHKFEQ